MMDELIKIIIGISGTVFGGFIGYFIRIFIEHRLAIDRIKENIRLSEFNRAAAKLRAAFAPAQVQILRRKKIGNIGLRKFFDDAFLVHAAAIEEFRPFASDHIAYQKAYDEYRQALFEDDPILSANQRWENNAYYPKKREEPQDFILHVSDKIDDILKLAKTMN